MKSPSFQLRRTRTSQSAHLPRRSLIALAAGGLFALNVAPAVAATIFVDGVNCTLSGAISNANGTTTYAGGCLKGAAGLDTLNLLDDITLTAPLPAIDSDITIEGNGHTIRRDPSAPGFGIFVVDLGGHFTLNRATVSGGSAGGNGGAVLINNFGTLTLSNSTISGNQAITGGGIYCSGASSKLNIVGGTISGNTAVLGGGILVVQDCSANIDNSTISGNVGTTGAAGLFVEGTNTTALVSDSTITDNASGLGAALFVASGGSASLFRSLVSGNRSDIGAAEVVGNVITTGANFFGHSGLANVQAFSAFTPDPFDVVATSDGNTPTTLAGILGPLANNGGPTLTHALVSGSPAIDRAGNACSGTDQRGVIRPQGSACDMGAFELEADTDGDGVFDADDNCPMTANADQSDRDEDGVGDACDAFPLGRCEGRAVTILGTRKNDVLTGTPGPDVIAGLDGNDSIDGRGGDDLICGGAGNDTLRGGDGNDRIVGGDGVDRLFGDKDDDTLLGGGGKDALNGGPGSDTCDGGSAKDTAKNCERRNDIP